MTNPSLYRAQRRFNVVLSHHPERFAAEPVAQGVVFWDGTCAVRRPDGMEAWSTVADLTANLRDREELRYLDNPG